MHRAGLASVAIALAAGLVFIGGASPVSAQTIVPPPVHSAIDANGVDLTTGSMNTAIQDLSIGAPGNGGLAFRRTYLGASTGWWANFDSALTTDGSGNVTVSIGSMSDLFNLSGGVYVNANGGGSTLTASGSNYIYTTSAGVIYTFSNYGQTSYLPTNTLVVTTATYPNGEVDTYQYMFGSLNFTLPYCLQSSCIFTRLQSISNNSGYQIHIVYAADYMNTDGSNWQQWWTRTNVIGLNNTIDYCSPYLNGCAGLTVNWPQVTYTGSPVATATDNLGRTTGYSYDSSGRIYRIQRPSGLAVTVSYNSSNQVISLSNGEGTWTYGYSASGSSLTTTETDPLTHTRVVVSNTNTNLVTSDTDGLGRTSTYAYDGSNRLSQVTHPEGDLVQYGYDARGNVLSRTLVAKPGSGLANIVEHWSYDATCTYPVKCNKPNAAFDALGAETDYTYDTSMGGILTATSPPAAPGATRPQTRFSYSQLYAWYKNSGGTIVQAPTPIYKLTGISACQTTASCAGTADEVKAAIAYGASGVANNLLPTSISKGAGDGSLTAVTATTYTSMGDVASVTGPLGASQTAVFLYDGARQQVGVIAPKPNPSGPLHFPAQRTTYSPDGVVIEVEQGYDLSQSDSNWSSFTSLEQTNITLDGHDRKASETRTSGGTTYSLIQYSYDFDSRPTCAATRMNPAAWSSLPSSACTLGAAGVYGADRITATSYDAADEVTQITVAAGAAAAANYVTNTYSNNGKLKTVLDAMNNLTTFTYDGVDRLAQVNFPSAAQGAGTSNSSDYESYAYDADGNLISVRRRSGDVISLAYDALRRVSLKTPPAWSGQAVYYGYDLLGRLLYAHYGSAGGAGVDLSYDALGRTRTETALGRTLTSAYDLAGDRIQLTWPDGFYINYDYDYLQRVTAVRENGAVSGIGVLASLSYDDQGRVAALAGGNGMSTGLGYDGVDRLTSLSQAFTNSSANVAWSFGRNPADQIVSRASSNEAYTSHPGVQSPTYTANGLNQYTNVGGTGVTYDARGNLTSDGVRSFAYDVENRLLSASTPTAVNYGYDPLGRLQVSSSGSASTIFLYDGQGQLGQALAAEYDGSGALLRRYVSLPGADLPLVWYEGAGTASRRWLQLDNQGSVMAYSDATGASGATYGYGPFGEPDATNGWGGSRYRYTGQIMLQIPQLYYYKARVYDPGLGRFLQSDPVGYVSDVNPYAYVKNDPINLNDPSGRDAGDVVVTRHRLIDSTQWEDWIRQLSPAAQVSWNNLLYSLVGSPAQASPASKQAELPEINNPCSGAGRAPSPQEYRLEGQLAGGMTNSYDPYGMAGAAGTFLALSNLYDFRRGGRLDAQVRYGGSPAYANYVYGVYTSAAGLTLAQALGGAQAYAAARSHYPTVTQFDPNYPSVPAANVKNITAGYNDQKNGNLCTVNH